MPSVYLRQTIQVQETEANPANQGFQSAGANGLLKVLAPYMSLLQNRHKEQQQINSVHFCQGVLPFTTKVSTLMSGFTLITDVSLLQYPWAWC